MPVEKREVELKFRVIDEATLQRKLAAAGARPRGKFDEENYFCDDASGTLRASDRILRLRRSLPVAGGPVETRLTYKEPVPDPRFKVRTEIEVAVDDFESIRTIFERVGFGCRLGYRRLREMWDLSNVFVTLDSLPFGQFVELEGTPDNIAAVAAQLGFDMAQGITKSYLTLAAEAGI